MKTTASLLTVGSFLLNLRADDIPRENEQPLESEPAVPSLPKWEPYSKVSQDSFFEQFDESWNKRWVSSEAVKDKPEDSKDDDDLFRYTGKWAVEEPTIYKVTEGDMGLVVKDPARHHAISSVFKKPIDNKDKPLIVQYEVKLQNGLECGGAYLKLLTYQKDFVAKKFDDKTPYTIMFGPDKCGSTNKVHFIFRHENPLNHTITEKHLESPPSAKHATKLTSLYTLIVRRDNTYEIKINQESVSKGSLLENFDPAVNPPKEIEDVTDKKPSDWIEEARIADPEAVKPEDWDETQPEQIPDESAKKPIDWLDSELLEIPDPTAIKPEDWVDDEDGEWTAPEIPNPKCEKISGCGEWIRPTIKNPSYKGKWKASMIDNPDYKGEWKPKMIPNPDFYEDLQPSNFPKIGGIGFELWTMQNNIMFDNIYIGYSEEEASDVAKATWSVKFAAEEAQRAAESKKHSPPEDVEPPSSEYFNYAIYHVKLFLKLARNDFFGTIQAMPKVAGGLAGGLLAVWLLASFVLNALFPAANPEADTTAQRKKDDLPVPDADPEEEESSKKEDSTS